MRKMNKVYALGLAMLLALAISVPVYAAHGDETAEMPNQVQLTNKQQKELASLYKDILKKEQKVIATYVKYGVLTPEQGKMISEHLNKRYMKLEQNGFVPQWGKNQQKHHQHKGHQGHQGHDHHHDHHKHRDTAE